MSNSNKNIIKNKNTKEYTVKGFCEKYKGTNVEQMKEALIAKVINPHYVSYEMKITICEKIIENSYYKKEEKNGINVKRLHINSPAEYMLYCLYLVKEYTNIEVDFSKALEEFNMLNECELLDIIINNIPEREFKEFRMILDMMENDVMQNEYEMHAFISNQIERFRDLIGTIVAPALDGIMGALNEMDDETLGKLIESFIGDNKLGGAGGNIVNNMKDLFKTIK